MNPQMDTEVMHQQRGPERITGQVRAAQFGPESGIITQAAGRNMIRVGVLPVRGENDLRPDGSKDLSQLSTSLQSRLQTAVRKIEIGSPGKAQEFRGRLSFAATGFKGAMRRRFAGRQFDHTDAQILPKRDGDDTSYADFRIIGMRCHNKDVERLHEITSSQFKGSIHSRNPAGRRFWSFGWASSATMSRICARISDDSFSTSTDDPVFPDAFFYWLLAGGITQSRRASHDPDVHAEPRRLGFRCRRGQQ